MTDYAAAFRILGNTSTDSRVLTEPHSVPPTPFVHVCVSVRACVSPQVQTLGFLSHVKSRGNNGPFMIVAPLSTLSNWVNEFERFLPGLPVSSPCICLCARAHTCTCMCVGSATGPVSLGHSCLGKHVWAPLPPHVGSEAPVLRCAVTALCVVCCACRSSCTTVPSKRGRSSERSDSYSVSTLHACTHIPRIQHD